MAFNSEKRKCNFYNVGYCRNWMRGCRFFHPEESCESENCKNRTCPRRHQRTCRYFETRKPCKHGVDCQFKHEERENEAKKDNLDKEIKDMKDNIRQKDEMIKSLVWMINF